MPIRTQYKLTCALLAFAIASQMAMAGGDGWLTSHKEAVAQSKKTGNPIMAEFTGSDWCPPCIQLKKDVFSSEQFKAWAKDNVVLLELDFPRQKQLSDDLKKQNQELAKQYAVSGFPTVLMLDTTGKVLGKTVGYSGNDPVAWIKNIEKMIGAAKPKMQKTLADAVKDAKENNRFLFVAITQGEDQNAIEALLKDKDFNSLSRSRISAVAVKSTIAATPMPTTIQPFLRFCLSIAGLPELEGYIPAVPR